jgi:hypothetical protein
MRAVAAALSCALFVSLMLVDAGAQGWRPQFQMYPSRPGAAAQQSRKKSIASVRNLDTADGSRVSITSDVPLNDYAAYWSGDRYFVVIPEADLSTRNVQALQSSLRGQGFQEVRIERKGNDVVISFRLQPGMRARVEQKFNRLDVIFTAPPGVTLNNRNGNTGRNSNTGTGNQQTNTSGNFSTVTGTGANNTSGGTTASTQTGGGGGRRTRGGRGGVRGSGYGGGGGGGDRGGGVPLNIPLPSDIQPQATPTASPSASPLSTPSATPTAGQESAQTSASPGTANTSASPTPEEIAQTQPQSPVTAPPVTAPPTTTTGGPTAPGVATETGFAAAIKDNWLPLLIGLLVLLAIGLLLVSRSRDGAGEAEERAGLDTRRREAIKEKPAGSGKTGAALVGGAAAGTAAVAAIAKGTSSKTAPAKEPVETKPEKGVEPVVPTVGMERVSGEVKNLLEGNDYDSAVIGSQNPDTRQIVSTELLAALASRNPDRRQRAREAFTKHGFFDEATKKLRTAETPAERITAARSLGLTQDRAATPHLTAALEDNDPEVRRASVNALAEMRDPAAIAPLNALLEREKNRKVPHSLIRRAIESSATIDTPETPAAATAAAPSAEAKDATATTTDKKDKDDEDREVFEI